MTQRTPVFYDSTQSVHRPMDSGDTIPISAVTISAQPGNTVSALSDGLYSGDYNGLILYVNSSTGSDSNPGTKAQPFLTVNGALTHLSSLFPSSQYRGQAIVALHAGLNYTWPASFDFTIYGGSLTLTFYGDPNYGDFNSPLVASTTLPAVMSNLQRPVIQPQATIVNSQAKLGGINRVAGSIIISGVTVSLPAASSPPGITNYGGYIDFIRSISGPSSGTVSIIGTVVNMTDNTAFWGFLAAQAGSTTYFRQFASQFQVNGILLSSTTSPTSAQLAARQYFIKFFQDYAGNNQTQLFLSSTSANSSSGSGIIFSTWADTEALVVTGSVTNLASFPFSFDSGYGLMYYIYNLNTASAGRYLNFINSRIM